MIFQICCIWAVPQLSSFFFVYSGKNGIIHWPKVAESLRQRPKTFPQTFSPQSKYAFPQQWERSSTPQKLPFTDTHRICSFFALNSSRRSGEKKPEEREAILGKLLLAFSPQIERYFLSRLQFFSNVFDGLFPENISEERSVLISNVSLLPFAKMLAFVKKLRSQRIWIFRWEEKSVDIFSNWREKHSLEKCV